MVSAELAGRFEAPIYGMLAVDDALGKVDWGTAGKPEIALHGQPLDETKLTMLWDGEWEVTYVTFRDMGAAFGVAILGIYLLVVAQFGSFKLPLVVLTPVPLTLIGIVLGHWMLGAAFTATSMIGFIALAGIIVRNSILLVDSSADSGARAWRCGRRYPSRGHAFQADRAHRRCGDHRRRFHPDGPDLPGPRHFPGVRPCLFHRADAARHTRHLHLAEGRRNAETSLGINAQPWSLK